MNIRIQDGFKTYMLCAGCEERFSKLETYYSKKIFYPVVCDNVCEFQYDERLFKFVISILWRLLHHSMLNNDLARTETFQKIVLRAEEKWRNYLLGSDELDEFNRLHLLIGVDVVSDRNNKEVKVPERLIQYMARYLDAGITDDGIDYCIGFIKLPRFFFLVPLAGFSDALVFNTEIFKTGGSYIIGEARVEDPTWAHLLINRVNQFEKALNSITPAQRQKMRDAGTEKWDQYKDKDLGDILRYQDNKFP